MSDIWAGAWVSNPAMIIPEAMQAIQALNAATGKGGVPATTLALLRRPPRLADRPDPVPDEIWDEAARHYDERGLGSLVLMIAVTNLFNRLNITTRQVAGAWG